MTLPLYYKSIVSKLKSGFVYTSLLKTIWDVRELCPNMLQYIILLAIVLIAEITVGVLIIINDESVSRHIYAINIHF